MTSQSLGRGVDRRQCSFRSRSLQVRSMYADPMAMSKCPHLRNVLSTWGRVGKISSMHVERLLALQKAGTPTKHPFAERFLNAGCLQQWCAAHRAAGGDNPKRMLRKDLLVAGVPLAAAHGKSHRRTRKTATSKRRAWMLFAADMMAKKGQRQTRAEKTEALRSHAAAFRALPPEARARYEDRAKAPAEQVTAAGGMTRAERVAQCNWGLASLDLPLSPDHAKRVVQSELETTELPGAI